MFKVLLLSMVVLAAPNLKPHVHGQAKVSIAFDKKNGKIEIEIPGDSIFGFESEAKSKKEKSAKEKALKSLESHIAQIIVFDTALACELKKDVFEVNQSAGHSDVYASFNVACQKSVEESTVVFNFQKWLPHLKVLNVEFLADGVQKSQMVQKDGESIVIK